MEEMEEEKEIDTTDKGIKETYYSLKGQNKYVQYIVNMYDFFIFLSSNF